MLGRDDDEEELAELVAACSNQVEQPDMFIDSPPVLNSPRGLVQSQRQTPQFTVELDPTVRALLHQNTQLMNSVRQQTQGDSQRRRD